MNEETRFWERVNLALDARRDPRDDESVRAALARRPELQRALRGLETVLVQVAPLRARPRRAPALALAALLLGGLALLRGSYEEDPMRLDPGACSAKTTRAPTEPGPPVSRVLSFSAEVRVTRGLERRTRHSDGRDTELVLEHESAVRLPVARPCFIASVRSGPTPARAPQGSHLPPP